jgi:hypothetical protein
LVGAIGANFAPEIRSESHLVGAKSEIRSWISSCRSEFRSEIALSLLPERITLGNKNPLANSMGGVPSVEAGLPILPSSHVIIMVLKRSPPLGQKSLANSNLPSEIRPGGRKVLFRSEIRSGTVKFRSEFRSSLRPGDFQSEFLNEIRSNRSDQERNSLQSLRPVRAKSEIR